MLLVFILYHFMTMEMLLNSFYFELDKQFANDVFVKLEIQVLKETQHLEYSFYSRASECEPT